MRRTFVVSWGLAAFLVAGLASPVSAQTSVGTTVRFDQTGRPPQTPARRPTVVNKPKPGIRVYGLVDFESMAANQTFKAITKSSQFRYYGVGVEITNVWKHAFVRAAFTKGKKDAERAFVAGGQVINNGVTGQVQMTPFEFGGGWRLEPNDNRGRNRYGIYVGAGVLVLGYKETYSLGTADENSSESFKGPVVFGGVDRLIGKYLVAGVEAQYRSVANAIGATDGTSVGEAFGETNLGGFVLRVLVGLKK